MRLFLVSYRLPFRVLRGRLVQNAGGLVSAMLAYAAIQEGASQISEVIWLGASDDTGEELAKARRSAATAKFTLIPISIPEKVDQQFYGGFCNDLIWPLFHYFPSISNFEERNWQAYQQANAIFCEEVCARAHPEDRIWIHDYHFLLLPRLIRERFATARIGFFLHIPFPSYEVIRQMPRPWLVGILNGMLGADLVGFHTYDYVQHFENTAET